jgi:alkylated DNA repair dioxygenase AlkB
MKQRLEIGRDAWIDYVPGWLSLDEANALLAELLTETPWEQLPINVFGKPVMQPRLMAWAGTLPYRYSGLTLDPRPMSPRLQELTERVSAEAGESFNHVLLNLYRNGADHMGMHADDERELGRDPIIGSMSLGETRRFVLKPKNRRVKKKREVRLLHGSLLVMGGACQHTWYHGVPKQPALTESRINLTFRRLMGPPGWRSAPERDALPAADLVHGMPDDEPVSRG